MRPAPHVSIGLPVRNGEAYLEQALQSILAQDFDDFELIISDNASSDRTATICRDLAATDPRVCFTRFDENTGAARNYNHVFAAARGSLFKWAAHDDVCDSRFLGACIAALEADPSAVLCHTVSGCIDAAGKLTGYYGEERSFDEDTAHQRFGEIINRPHFCLSVFGVIRTAVLKKTGLIGAYAGSDRTLLAELGLHGKLLLLPDLLFYRRDHARASMRAHPDERDRAAWFDPANRGAPVFPTLRRGREYAAAIDRAPLGADDRQRCHQVLEHWKTNGLHHSGQPISDLLQAEAKALANWQQAQASGHIPGK